MNLQFFGAHAPHLSEPRRRRSLRQWWRRDGRAFLIDLGIYAGGAVLTFAAFVALLAWAGNWAS